MESKIIKDLKEEKRRAFLKLPPDERIFQMERIFYEILSCKALEEGVTESEIYQRYVVRDKKRRRAV